MMSFNIFALVFVVLCSVFSPSVSLYEDQIGKFDWKHSYIGKLKFSSFDPAPNGKRLFVATEENVVAALNLKTGQQIILYGNIVLCGQILWRHILEEGSRGAIHLMVVNVDVVTISGASPRVVRGWDPTTGVLQWEWMLPQPSSDSTGTVWWFLSGGDLRQVELHYNSHVDVGVFALDSGANVSTHVHPAAWAASGNRCAFSAPYLMCLSTQGEETVLMTLDCEGGAVESRPLAELVDDDSLPGPEAVVEPVPGGVPAVALVGAESSKYLVYRHGSGLRSFVAPLPTASSLTVTFLEGDLALHFTEPGPDGVDLQVADLLTGDLLSELSGRLDAELPAHWSISAATCGSRKGRGPGCKILFSCLDHSIALVMHPGKTVWVREEALASIIAVEMLDLPVSDTDAAIEQEFDHKESGFVGMFVHRIASQLFQLRAALLAALGVGDSRSDGQRAGLVRDEFGLHKVIVAATASGKVFGIDNLNGEVLWQHWLEDGEPFTSGTLHKPHAVLFVQRTNRHFPKPAQCVLVLRSKATGEGLLLVFNPITGQAVDGGLERLGYAVRQASLLHQPGRDSVRGVLLLDTAGRLHVFPESAREVAVSVAPATFLFTAEPGGTLTGHSLVFSRGNELVAKPVWTVRLTDRITSIVGKSPLERVHSQGRVLGDRSVLYKYVNPNLVAVVTEATDAVHKFVTSVYLLDVVSGSVVFSTVHRRARGPVHLVHSENWVVYTYFSDKFRRTELVALELYEGKVQSNTTAFSSMSTPLQPIVDRQAFILPSHVQSMKETITEKGITSKHILVALASGWVLELPWVFVDPRRPSTVTPEMREEGVIPYMPELPLPSDSVINYNQTLERVRGIHTSPSGLESTCLVLVYGLDVFYTRVAPSKTFDLLKEDFDYYLITVVLSALLIASYVTKKLASKKALKQAWK